jgi:hypothetical protein
VAKLNARALVDLLEAEDRPVGRLVAQKAQAIVDTARLNARTIMHSMPEAEWEAVADAIDFEQHGLEATIGIRDQGRISRYLAHKESREGAVLRRAVQHVFNRRE